MLSAMLALSLMSCPPWPGLIVEDWTDSLMANTAPYPGVSWYIPKWVASPEEITLMHARGWKVMAVYQLPPASEPYPVSLDNMLAMFGWLGYDAVVLDEPVQRFRTQLSLPAAQAAGRISDAIRVARPAQLAKYPRLQLGVVEPFAPNLRDLLALRAPLDFVAGEDYGGVSVGDISLSDLAYLKSVYGVSTQQWVVGADEVLAAYGRVDQVVAVDVHGSWKTSRAGDYADALRIRLGQTHRLYLPLTGGNP